MLGEIHERGMHFARLAVGEFMIGPNRSHDFDSVLKEYVMLCERGERFERKFGGDREVLREAFVLFKNQVAVVVQVCGLWRGELSWFDDYTSVASGELRRFNQFLVDNEEGFSGPVDRRHMNIFDQRVRLFKVNVT